jgi:hypothetical protein
MKGKRRCTTHVGLTQVREKVPYDLPVFHEGRWRSGAALALKPAGEPS